MSLQVLQVSLQLLLGRGGEGPLLALVLQLGLQFAHLLRDEQTL